MLLSRASPFRILRSWFRWLTAGSRREREQLFFDRRFWGLIHDHNWLQYEPPKGHE